MLDHPHYIKHITYHIFILKPDYFQTDAFQITLLAFIHIHNFIILMRKSIEFYDQTNFLTIKINDKVTYRFLTNKTQSIHLTTFELIPQ